MKRIYWVAAFAAAWFLGVEPAGAGGLQLPTRGVRPSARAGAFVAGADDLNAQWFNPAGLGMRGDGHAARTFLFDLGYVDQSVSYRRIDSGNNPRDVVDDEAAGLPIPTLGVAVDLDDRLTVAGGVYAPYAALVRYPEDGAQRYSVIDLSESLLFIVQASVAYRVSDRLRVGAGIQNMVFHLVSTLVFSGCPGQTVCAPEDPEFDAIGKVKQTDLFNPSAVLGVQYDVSASLRLGASFQLPFFIAGEGDFETRLPSSGFYNGAEVMGDRADVSFTLPATARAGVELSPSERLRLELAASVEFWSQHDEFLIDPQNVRIEGAPGVGSYEIGPLRIPRDFQNTYAVHLGGEGRPLASLPLDVLLGYAYETAAAPERTLSVITADGAKHLITGGLGYRFGGLAVHAMVGFAAVEDRTVSPDVGRAPQLTPIRDESAEPLGVYVNWGDYQSSWIMGGLGISGGF